MNVRDQRTTDGRDTGFIDLTLYLRRFAPSSSKLTIANQAVTEFQRADQELAKVEAQIRTLEELNLKIESLGPKLLEQSKANKAETELIKQHLAGIRTPATKLKEFREKFNKIKGEATTALNISLGNIEKAPDLSKSTEAELKRQKIHLDKIINPFPLINKPSPLSQELESIQDQMIAIQKELQQFDKSTPLVPGARVGAVEKPSL